MGSVLGFFILGNYQISNRQRNEKKLILPCYSKFRGFGELRKLVDVEHSWVVLRLIDFLDLYIHYVPTIPPK